MSQGPTTRSDNQLTYYASQGMVTDPDGYGPLLNTLPESVDGLVAALQGIMVHVFWAGSRGLTLSDQRKREVNLRTVPRMLERIRELDDRPLAVPRQPEHQLVGNCRDHSVLMTAALRSQGVPARARCGFATYLVPDHFEDHWVCEYWNAAEQRWVMVDAQLDEPQREAMHITLNPLDVPRDRFLTGGCAWQVCRSGGADPSQFGIFDMSGLPFVLGNLVRDFLALNKIEILPWDGWGLMVGLDEEIPDADLPLLDQIAALSAAAGTQPVSADETWSAVRALYESEARIHKPADCGDAG